jgi:hypothetical protein
MNEGSDVSHVIVDLPSCGQWTNLMLRFCALLALCHFSVIGVAN